MKNHEAVLAASAEIDAKLDALENYAWNSKRTGYEEEEIACFTPLICAFNLGRHMPIPFETLEQMKRLKLTPRKILRELIPKMVFDHS
jgi:hypothetical protein